MTLTIREGGYYWRRDGVRVGPMERTNKLHDVVSHLEQRLGREGE